MLKRNSPAPIGKGHDDQRGQLSQEIHRRRTKC